MEQKERKKHERQESASSSRRNGFSNCFSCRSYSSNTSFVLLVLLSVQNFPTESFMVARSQGDASGQSRPSGTPGDHKGPPSPPSSTLPPTEYPPPFC